MLWRGQTETGSLSASAVYQSSGAVFSVLSSPKRGYTLSGSYSASGIISTGWIEVTPAKTGTPVLVDVLGEISLEFTLLSGESLELKLPVGDYIITEYTDWSWRYSATEDPSDGVEDVERDVAIISRYDTFSMLFEYDTPTNTLWLNSYSVTSYPGKEPEITS